MPNDRTAPRSARGSGQRRWHHRIVIGSAVVALAVGGTIVAATASTTPHTTPQLQSIKVSPYSNLLANSKSHTLYVLSAESAGKLHCTGACLKVWPPFLVKSSVKTVSRSKAVKGKIGFIKRSATTKQVTFNGYPIYFYSGDSGARQLNGEGIVADGGTWTLANAAAATKAATPVKAKSALNSEAAPPYSHVLTQASNLSLYVLSAESGGTLHCTGGCVSTWPPLEVATSVTSIKVATGVKGTIGFIKRTTTMKQVTFNGFPVYTYLGDYGANGSSGEGIAADGGTWYLANASATTSGGTETPPAPPSSTTSTTYQY